LSSLSHGRSRENPEAEKSVSGACLARGPQNKIPIELNNINRTISAFCWFFILTSEELGAR